MDMYIHRIDRKASHQAVTSLIRAYQIVKMGVTCGICNHITAILTSLMLSGIPSQILLATANAFHNCLYGLCIFNIIHTRKHHPKKRKMQWRVFRSPIVSSLKVVVKCCQFFAKEKYKKRSYHSQL